MIKALDTILALEERLGEIEDEQAALEKEKEALWKRIFEHFDMNGTDRLVFPNGMSLARVLQHRTTFDSVCGQNLLPSSLWPRITKREIDPGAYTYELKAGAITPEQDAQICTVKVSWMKRHESATKEELRELKGAE